MSKKNKHRWALIIITITLILGSVFAVVYLQFYYKPMETIDVPQYADNACIDTLSDVNETIRDMNTEDIIFIVIFSFVIACAIALIGTAIYEGIVLRHKEVIKVKAILKSKEIAARVQHSKTGLISSSYVYYLTFKKENGEEITFTVSPVHYATILKGNRGTLEYKESLHYRFIDFQVEGFSD